MFYKGIQYGLPWSGPNSLAGQWERLGARIIDALLQLPVLAGAIVLMFVTHAIRITTTYVNGVQHPQPHTNLVLITLFYALTLVVYIAYEAIMTKLAGRTVGKMAMGMRVVTVANPQQTVTPGQAAARVSIHLLPRLIPYGGSAFVTINDLWCLGDDSRQCLHDKVVKTLVVTTR